MGLQLLYQPVQGACVLWVFIVLHCDEDRLGVWVYYLFPQSGVYQWCLWGEGNSNPLQCSCLENPRDGGAWWAAVYGVAQSRTRLKQLSSSSSSSSDACDYNFLVSYPGISSVQFSHSVMSNSATPWIAAHQASLSITREFTQTHIHRVSDAIQPLHPLSSPFPPAPNPSQHQALSQWVNSSYEVAKVLEFQL